MNTNTFLKSAEEYLFFRRNLGFSMAIEGAQVLRFARWAESIGHPEPLTVELALQWATAQARSHLPLNHARRLDIVRRFAKYLKLSCPQTEIPPEGILGSSYRRLAPHIYSEGEIAALIYSAIKLTPCDGLRPHTYATLFGLLACTGIRISEALRLKVHDFDRERRLLRIVESKFHKSRILPLHPSTAEALTSYLRLRNRRHPAAGSMAFFLTERGTSLKYLKVLLTFLDISSSLGWRSGTGRGPRIHDLRHSYAVRKLLQWYQDGEDVNRRIPELATYLGHCKVADTYWYLTAVPELMQIVALRFERYALKEVPNV